MTWKEKYTIDQSNLTIQQAREQLYPNLNCPEIALYQVEYCSWEEGYRDRVALLWLPRKRELQRAPLSKHFDHTISVEGLREVAHKVQGQPLSASTCMELGLRKTEWSDRTDWELPDCGFDASWEGRTPTFDEIVQAIRLKAMKDGREQFRSTLNSLLQSTA